MKGPCVTCTYKFKYMTGDLEVLPRSECSEEEINLEKCDKYFPESSKVDILQFVEKHKGELVIDGIEAVRLISFKKDRDDYYYEVQSLRRGRYWTSCVGRLIPLKGCISDKEYDCIEHLFNLNIGWSLERQKLCDAKKKIEKVFVTWDPLYEEVVCVHRNPDSECDKCRAILNEKRDSYHLSEEEFEVRP